MLRKIVWIHPSGVFGPHVSVLLTDCEHRHVRPNSMFVGLEAGLDYDCHTCDDDLRRFQGVDGLVDSLKSNLSCCCQMHGITNCPVHGGSA